MVDVERPYLLVAVNYRKPKHHLGELYSLITKLLLNQLCPFGRWVLKESPTYPFDVCLGESIGRGIPFKALASSGGLLHPPLVNFYQNFKQLTWKVEMVLTLDRFCRSCRVDINTIIPETYVFQCGKPVNRRQRHDLIESFMLEDELKRMSNVWILKPSGGGKGKGIEVVSDNDLSHCCYAYYMHANSLTCCRHFLAYVDERYTVNSVRYRWNSVWAHRLGDISVH
jgi:hypothetical protein